MALTIEDLKPKSFTVNIKGVELQCKPLRMSHTLIISKVGEVFQNINTATRDQIKPCLCIRLNHLIRVCCNLRSMANTSGLRD